MNKKFLIFTDILLSQNYEVTHTYLLNLVTIKYSTVPWVTIFKKYFIIQKVILLKQHFEVTLISPFLNLITIKRLTSS